MCCSLLILFLCLARTAVASVGLSSAHDDTYTKVLHDTGAGLDSRHSGRRLMRELPIAKSSLRTIRAKRFDSTYVLQSLYGKGFSPKLTAGKQDKQVFVLGLHNSGTSVATRVIMLMGLFQGNIDDITIAPKNLLKYWERRDVFWTADRLLSKYSDPEFTPWQGQSVDFSNMQQSDVDDLLMIAERTLADVARHEPSVVKDPRMCWTFALWEPILERPLCVIVYKDPIANAVSLAENTTKSNFGKKIMTSQRWLSTWESMMMHALHGCVGVPTVLFKSKHFKVDMKYSIDYLYEALKHAGVETIRQPTEHEIDSAIMFHFDTAHYAAKPACSAAEVGLETNTSKLPCSIQPVFTKQQAVMDDVLSSVSGEMMANLDSVPPAEVAQHVLTKIQSSMDPQDWEELKARHPLAPKQKK